MAKCLQEHKIARHLVSRNIQPWSKNVQKQIVTVLWLLTAFMTPSTPTIWERSFPFSLWLAFSFWGIEFWTPARLGNSYLNEKCSKAVPLRKMSSSKLTPSLQLFLLLAYSSWPLYQGNGEFQRSAGPQREEVAIAAFTSLPPCSACVCLDSGQPLLLCSQIWQPQTLDAVSHGWRCRYQPICSLGTLLHLPFAKGVQAPWGIDCFETMAMAAHWPLRFLSFWTPLIYSFHHSWMYFYFYQDISLFNSLFWAWPPSSHSFPAHLQDGL